MAHRAAPGVQTAARARRPRHPVRTGDSRGRMCDTPCSNGRLAWPNARLTLLGCATRPVGRATRVGRGGVGAIPDVGRGRAADDRGMTTVPATSRVPVGAVLLAGLGAQLVDDVAYFVLPPAAL